MPNPAENKTKQSKFQIIGLILFAILLLVSLPLWGVPYGLYRLYKFAQKRIEEKKCERLVEAWKIVDEYASKQNKELDLPLSFILNDMFNAVIKECKLKLPQTVEGPNVKDLVVNCFCDASENLLKNKKRKLHECFDEKTGELKAKYRKVLLSDLYQKKFCCAELTKALDIVLQICIAGNEEGQKNPLDFMENLQKKNKDNVQQGLNLIYRGAIKILTDAIDEMTVGYFDGTKRLMHLGEPGIRDIELLKKAKDPLLRCWDEENNRLKSEYVTILDESFGEIIDELEAIQRHNSELNLVLPKLIKEVFSLHEEESQHAREGKSWTKELFRRDNEALSSDRKI